MGKASASRMRGLGPRSLEQLAALGISSAEELRAQDAFALYARLKARWPGASLNLLYALIGAQEDLDWREVARERRTDILLRLDDMGLAPR
ncbi:TfoX/Sxy family DNA transformation protein [Mitsuaria sp. WAJ17]|uniref:TfoX/Sxy family DNA transformation protein n=1 Tax=Mitsuaria sp. WAJ17 TaxID=2761452 RepID=UPI001C80DF22|nr:TfoX/Sxy family DNA transformation protein [Mitsuaria sp. WAJ17]